MYGPNILLYRLCMDSEAVLWSVSVYLWMFMGVQIYCIELNLNDVDPVLRGLSETETNINLVIKLVAMYTVSVKLQFLHSRG